MAATALPNQQTQPWQSPIVAGGGLVNRAQTTAQPSPYGEPVAPPPPVYYGGPADPSQISQVYEQGQQTPVTMNSFYQEQQAPLSGGTPSTTTYDPNSNMGPFLGDDTRADFPQGYNPQTGTFATEADKQAALAQRQLNPMTGAMQPLEGQMTPSTMPDTQYNLQAPQGNYGLSGAEQALQAGLNAQTGALTQGAYDAFGTMQGGMGQARSDMSGYLSSGLSALRGGVDTGREDINQATTSGVARFDPYSQTGQGALDVEAALSGALGPEAQAQAFANYQESPGQQWAREQQEKSLVRNAAATGGTQSGNVLSALQEQAAGIASQNYQQDLGNLRSLAERGQSAAGSQAGIETQAGRDLAQMEMSAGQSALSANTQTGAAIGNMAFQGGMNQANLQQALGQNLSNVYGGTASNLAGLRYGAGQDIASQLGMTGQQLAQLQSGQGTALANIDQQTATNAANLAAQQGQQTSGLRTDLAALLSNLAVGSGTQQSNLATQLGQAQAGGVTNPYGNTASTLTGLIASNPELISSILPAYNSGQQYQQ